MSDFPEYPMEGCEKDVTYPEYPMVRGGSVDEVKEVDFQPRVLEEIHLIRKG